MLSRPVLINSMTEILGSYKISEKLLKKLTCKNVVGISGQECRAASSYELDAIIYFTRISDSSGYIKEFKISELQNVLGCSLRTTYDIIDGLKQKGYIKISGNTWNGVKDVTLLDNDSSNITDFHEFKYLNTNYILFDNTNADTYSSYKNLSLYAKRTLLVLLFNYNKNYGYRASVDTIKEYLGIKSRALVVKYINEIETILGDDFCTITKDSKNRLKHGNINMPAKNIMLTNEQGISNLQDSYFKRSWELFLKNNNIIDYDLYKTNQKENVNTLLNTLFSTVYIYVQGETPLVHINRIISEAFTSLGVLNEYTIHRIKENIKKELGTPKNKIIKGA